MRALLLAGLVLAAPAAVHASDLASTDEGDFGEDAALGDTGQGGRLRITAWAGQAWATSGGGPSPAIAGGEISWAFDHLDVGVAGYGYRGLSEDVGGTKQWDPVLLVRFTQRFETYRGVDAGLTLGAGSARRSPGTNRPPRWEAWFQLGLGLRIDLGPVYLAGELAFEQNDLIHLTGGLGVKLF